MQGLAGGLAGGVLGSLLFGGIGHASPGGMMGGGIGLLEIAIIGLLLFFAYRFFQRRRARQTVASGNYSHANYQDEGSYAGPPPFYSDAKHGTSPALSEVEQDLRQMRQSDPSFSEEALRETFQDLFFRVQAAWMNRTLEGVEEIITGEMVEFFGLEFEAMKSKGRINRLENIAIRKIELSEVWQETRKIYVTVLFTANLLDYTLDEKTGQVIGGDALNPVKFQEFWTFSRSVGSSQWKLSAINQEEKVSTRVN
jgi:predicted lipid-binding transport protein (Tim44 family)